MLRIGVCEDQAGVRKVLVRGLQHAGHEVVAAHDGREALTLFTEVDLDAIVMDIGLPDADGRDVVQALKSAGQQAPVLFLTAYGAMHERLAGFAAGGDDYVVKPFELKEVLARLDVLARRGGQREHPRLLHPPDPQQARPDRIPDRHRHRARGGLHDGRARVKGLRRRLVVAVGVISTLVALALIGIVQVMIHSNAEDATSRVLVDRADAVVHASTRSGRLDVPDGLLQPGVAVYADGHLVAGHAPVSLAADFAGLSTVTQAREIQAEETYALLGQPFTTDSGALGVVVLAEPLAPYEHDEHTALVVSLAAGALMVLLATGAAAWISRRALAPVGEMAHTAQEWSEHDLERRFALGEPHDEITALGRTLDGLLARVATAIRTEQRLTGELAHELRTPLTTVSGIAELMAMREDLDDQLHEDIADIQAACRDMSMTVRVLIDLARSDTTHGDCTVADIGEALAQHYRDSPALTLDLASSLRVAAPLAAAIRALTPVIDNALELAGAARVAAATREPEVVLTVSDTGPGLSPDLVGDVFEPGVSTRGSGLGLALARRVARSLGGDVVLVGAQDGCTFEVRLPGAPDG